MRTASRRFVLWVVAVGALSAMLAGAAPALASTAWLKLATASTPTNLPPGQEGTINLTCPSPDFEQIMWDV